MSDNDMVMGFYPKAKHEKAPDFVIGKASINVAQFREWMKGYLAANPDAEWINLDMKVSKAGKGYAVIDTWEPPEKKVENDAPQAVATFDDDSALPF